MTAALSGPEPWGSLLATPFALAFIHYVLSSWRSLSRSSAGTAAGFPGADVQPVAQN